jgi:hypothetical protein
MEPRGLDTRGIMRLNKPTQPLSVQVDLDGKPITVQPYGPVEVVRSPVAS